MRKSKKIKKASPRKKTGKKLEKFSAKEIRKFYNSQDLNHFQKPTRRRYPWLIFVVLIFGLIGGFLGTFLFLSKKNINLPFFGNYNLEEHLPKREITIKTQEKVTVTEDERIEDLAGKLISQQVNVYLKKPVSKDILGQIYYPNESLGKALILSSDGWLISHKNIFSSVKSEKKRKPEYVIITADSKLYSVNKILFDSLTDVAFLKIEANNLPVAMLANKEEIKTGQNIFAFNKNNELQTGRIKKIKYFSINKKEDLIKSINEFSEYLLIDEKFNKNFVGSAITNLSGSVVGIINKPGQAVPINYLKILLDQVLKEGKNLKPGINLKRPNLGIYYLELSQIVGLTSKAYAGQKEGVIVYGNPEEGTPAAKAGLKDGDIILKIDNDIINKEYSFLDLIQSYKFGQEVEMIIKRAGEEEKIKVKLGE